MLSFTERDPPFAECVGNCIVHIAPGTHWLRVGGPGVVEGERELDIEWPSRVKVQPRTENGKRTGLTLGILGMALIGTGAALIFAGESGSNSGEGTVTLLGLASVATGAVLTPLGWVKYARTSPTVEVEALE